MSVIRIFIAMICSLFGIILTIPVVVLGLPFWTVASLTKIFFRLVEPRVLSWQQLIEFTPTVGWKPKGDLNARYLTYVKDGVFHTITDSQGWLGEASITKSEIVVFGDSYAFGYGVNVKDCFFSRPNGRAHIKAIGAPGYNMVQEVLLMDQISSQLKDKLVIWFIYFGNDLYENLLPNFFHYRMPFVRKVNGAGNWEIVTSHISSERWFFTSERRYLDRLAEICSPTFLAQRAYSACEFLIEKGRDVCDRAGARLVVMTIPDITQVSQNRIEKLAKLAPDPNTFDPDLPDQKIQEICYKLGVSFVALKDHLNAADYKERDPHWSERGHQRVAEVLYGLYYDYTSKKQL